ncbi:hypothetical protein JCM11641_006085 [Rhodosporidiobolus odoratus]
MPITQTEQQDERPWHAAFPSPKASPSNNMVNSISAQELRAKMDKQREATRNGWIVVDVRRTDFEDAFIKGAINLPAHSFYPTLPSLLPILSRYPLVIFHCQSSSGRGPRCAGWYQDALDAAGLSKDISRAVVLTGGIKDWVAAYGEDGEVTVKLEY